MFNLPCEAKKKVAVWLALPSALGDFPRDNLNRLRSIQFSILTFIFHLLKEMKVFLICHKDLKIILEELITDSNVLDFGRVGNFYQDDQVSLEEIKKSVGENIGRKLFVVDLPYDDIWLRDTSPLFFGDHSLSFTFNGWGEKFSFENDSQIAQKLLVETEKLLKIPYQKKHKKSSLIAEGGGIEGNGKGILLVTKSVFCHPNRGGKKVEELENILKDLFYVRKLIFLSGGLIDDDTDGHIDNVARFVDEKTLLCLTPNSFDENDEEAKTLKGNYDILQEQLKDDVKIFKFPRIPLHRRRKILDNSEQKNQPIPSASYLNFFIAEKSVYVPVFFFDEEEKSTLQYLKSFFPQKKLVTVDWRVGILGGGGLHCLTQPIFSANF